MTTRYSDIPASRIEAVRKILRQEGAMAVVHDHELAVVHRFMVHCLPPEDAAYRILELRDNAIDDDD